MTYVNTFDLKISIIFLMNKKHDNLYYIDLIKQILNEQGLSQQKFADIIKVNQTTVSQWLLGNKKPGYDSILSICKNFNVTPNEFFGFE